MSPIRKHPAILTANVPYGNAEGKVLCINFDTRYLDMLPRNPPEPTSKSDLIIVFKQPFHESNK